MSVMLTREEKGASAVLLAMSMLMIMGLVAIAVDLGIGFNERRQDQTAADLGVMAGATEILAGEATIRDEALSYARSNLPTTFTDEEWATAWLDCVDPDAAGYGLNFVPVRVPTAWNTNGWNPSGVTHLSCMNLSPLGYFRLRLPAQTVETNFAKVIGVDSLSTGAEAIALLGSRARGGILPFALVANAAGGDHICLSSGPTGLAEDPCDGPTSGDFGTLRAPFFGNPELGTTENCNAAPSGEVLSVNIALGLDHLVILAPSASSTDEVPDVCFNFGVNALYGDPGFPNNGVEQGLAGPMPGIAPAGTLPRLQDSDNTSLRFGRELDDYGLWEYIDDTLDGFATPPEIPTICDSSTFDNSNVSYLSHPTYLTDWNGDGIPDMLESWEHMQACLEEFTAGSYPPIFTTEIEESPRFAYTPQFYAPDLDHAQSDPYPIKLFRATWIQGTWWKQGSTWSTFHPGEPCAGTCAANQNMVQISGFVLPDLALPTGLRGNPPPWASGGVNPFEPTLWE